MTNSNLVDDAHRTTLRLDTVAAELAGLVTELRSLLEQLAQIEEKRQDV